MGYQYIIALIILLVVAFTFTRIRKRKSIQIFNASTTVEELEQHAQRAALDHSISQKKIRLYFPLTHMTESYKFILELHNILNEDLYQKRSVPPAAEWLLDNFYIIEEQVKSIRTEITKKNYLNLPVLKKGPFSGYTRIYAIAMEYIAAVDGQIEESTLEKFIQGYQKHAILFDREIRMIPTMLRLSLIENIRTRCESISETRAQWHLSNTIIDTWLAEDDDDLPRMIKLLKGSNDNIRSVNSSFVEHLLYRLRRSGRSYSSILEYLDAKLEIYGTSAEQIVKQEHNIQANNTVTMGNYIMSFRYINSINWSLIFDNLSYVEQILAKDPHGYYSAMDLASRGMYLRQIEKLAKKHEVSELHIARVVVELSEKAAEETTMSTEPSNLLLKRSHVGYYLLAEGITEFEANQKGKVVERGAFLKKWLNLNLGTLFISIFSLITIAIVSTLFFSAMATATHTYGLFIKLITVAMLIIPASELATILNNWIISSIMPPTFFPRLELKDGISDSMKTVVVMPAILNNETRVDELLEHLESHYLTNKENNLYFALIGAFKDSKDKPDKKSQNILNYAISGVTRLNDKYSKSEEPGVDDIFYFYHRRSVYNENDHIWTGWERKRGALMEFNEMLLGSETTSFIRYSKNNLDGESIKYIITLDADTVLPFDMAKKMIGTMSHPLNIPIIDAEKHIVTNGYGLMQPKVTFDMDSSNRSLFSRIFTGMVGIDPYASAVSDVYQDLFGEGIFTGKGIYDLKIFNTVMKDVVPENAVLSHDLLEGSYVRAALVSHLELVDAYPSKYNAYVARLQRWIRGDWQLLPWIGRIINNKNDQRIVNPLNNISIFKIADNLRRSLLAPSLLLLMLLGFSILPGNGVFWATTLSIMVFLPLIVSIINLLIRLDYKKTKSRRHLAGSFGLKAQLLQIMLLFIFLPYQALVNIKAITITLVRVLITRKKMLEWITSDDAEKMQSNTLRSYLQSMGFASLAGLPLIASAYFFKLTLLPLSILIAILWFVSPVIAYMISRDSHIAKEELTSDNIENLRKIARRTWRYFEEYANAKNNYLAPDNYQEIPYKGIAPRTSPTNIGLGMLATLSAHDFGFIGLQETLLNIERTVNTVEKLDKWHGHLLNWYDTRTLIPLKPRYISTVDSGNYVCYLITLSEGLKTLASETLVKHAYVAGLQDTIKNTTDLDFSDFQDLETEENQIDLLKWYRALIAFNQNSHFSQDIESAWTLKTKLLTESLISEVETFMPWIPLLMSIPSVFNTPVLSSETQEMLNHLKLNHAIDTAYSKLNPLRFSMQAIKHKAKNLKQSEQDILSNWLNHLLHEVKIGICNTRDFDKKINTTIQRIEQLAKNTEFIHLYESRRQLFSIGYNLEDNRLTNSYYDLLASEARQTSYLAIARGEVPAKHWQKLGRTLTMVDRYKGLISWSGTMFEYLMPLIIMKPFQNTLLDETYSFVIKSQKKYAKQRQMPWGVSESAFNSVDLHLDYQYKAIGVPWLGLKRGLIEDAVVAPYATFLALMVDPVEAYKNIERLRAEGLEGQYGFYEAADYTLERLNDNEKHTIIKSYMAHHQGMILLSLSNYVNDNILQKRFFSNAEIKSANLLLQEKIPTHVVFAKEKKEKIRPFKGAIYSDVQVYRRYTEIDEVLSKTHVLSNGYYSVMVTDKGTGYSKTKDYFTNRWREDPILDQYGAFFYLKNVDKNTSWSSAYAPYNVAPDQYEITFTSDKATFKRKDDQIETLTEIIVTSGDNAEVRRVKIKNIGDELAHIELTSYFEIVMAEHNADISHPAFSNLFIETEYDESLGALIAHRRSRKASEPTKWIAQIPVVDGAVEGLFEYETDRMQFIGRGNSLKNPRVMESNKPLSKSVGTVLDPIFSFRAKIKLDPQQSLRISFVTLVAESKEAIYELIKKYSAIETCDAAFWLAVIRSQVETRYLNIKAPEMTLYQEMISDIIYLSPMRLNVCDYISINKRSQSGLWKFGISGDRPILLLTLEKIDDVEILYDILKAHEYWRLKDLRVDLVILLKEENNYLNTLQSMVNDIVESTQTIEQVKLRGDVFVMNYNNLEVEDHSLLHAVARMSFNAASGTLEAQFTNSHHALKNLVDSTALYVAKPMSEPIDFIDKFDEHSLQFYNGIGGFNQKGSAYVIHLNRDQVTPLPWSNVVANPNFGFLVTELGGGYTWFGNSRENKLTHWSNDAVVDPQGEIIYISEVSDSMLDLWSLTPHPIREPVPYTVEHGFGYTKFSHESHVLSQELIQFVPLDASVKINLISLKNNSQQPRKLTLTHYIKPVMGVNASQNAMHLQSTQVESGALVFTNPYNHEFVDQKLYMISSSENSSVCANRKAFFGLNDESMPYALMNPEGLNNHTGSCLDPCGAVQITISLEPGETVKCVFLLGLAESTTDLDANTEYYKVPSHAEKALSDVHAFWSNKLSIVKVNTPDVSMNILLNGWLLYQVITCRLWARTAFYQAGGAFGFRDQLQDSLALLTVWPELAREQILKHAAHQFIEGDVLHWWHEPSGKGPRTRISDDYLWLAYVTAEYVRVTGDAKILDEQVHFLTDAPLSEHEEERYSNPSISNESATLYEHCLRSIDHGLRFGEHGLPLMHGGDWNDGMNMVGIEGKGESIWLGWFLFKTLNDFLPIVLDKGDNQKSAYYKENAINLATAIDQYGWDGKWYKRAYFDDGTALGSDSQSECKIDAIAQAWSVLSGAGDPEKSIEAMASVENYLINKEDGLIRLLTPPFDRSNMEPGYIKGYVPGVRENGGQYTHGAVWVIAAYAKLGDGDKAHELFELINPINHTNTYREMMTYKAEPYVMAADVYSVYPHIGRGGWSWYTGAAGWMYQVGIESILGFRREGDTVFSEPSMPKKWAGSKAMVQYNKTSD